ncbi:BgtTE-56054 [Blumeria graminis f. sp. tritici]|uniref:BgtTE-56054 n=1 Tax=Blumeria graminis f. sp. tritici TaxID=62690 RepID=A0A9X9MFJ8_BLUGR|nr:BgtTE-56054 [Blumeria graminis f. sp. tritici]
MKCAYSSISPLFVTLLADLIQSTISVSAAGYAPETHRTAFPP